jgi:hypothetical protein
MKATQKISVCVKVGFGQGVGTLIVPRRAQIDWAGLVNLLKDMVGTETRTPDLYRVKAAFRRNSFTLTALTASL